MSSDLVRTEAARMGMHCGERGGTGPGVLLHTRVATPNNNALFTAKELKQRILGAFITEK
jgi:hypothetical protein